MELHVRCNCIFLCTKRSVEFGELVMMFSFGVVCGGRGFRFWWGVGVGCGAKRVLSVCWRGRLVAGASAISTISYFYELLRF